MDTGISYGFVALRDAAGYTGGLAQHPAADVKDPASQEPCDRASTICSYRDAAETKKMVGASEEACRRVSRQAGLSVGTHKREPLNHSSRELACD